MENTKDPRYYVADEENVVRLLSTPGCYDEQGLTPEAFSLYHKNEDYVSVLRTLFLENLEDALGLGKRIKKWPQKGDTFFGYCVLNVGRIRALSTLLDVISCYTETFPAHAGITYKDKTGLRIVNQSGEPFPPELFELQNLLCFIAEDITEAQ